jgi:calcineurin-like phosphoesterase family protein
MSRDIWVISDTHFNQASMLKFTDWTSNFTRPGFRDVDHMDEFMMDNWNSVVKPGDKVYHLGDVVGGSNQVTWMEKNFTKLNGKKRLVVGNHDNIGMIAGYGWFEKIMMWRPFMEFGLMLTHVPLHQGSLLRPKNTTNPDTPVDKDDPDAWSTTLNIHGHIHSNPSPDGPYRCVCVEQINYTPINIEELRIW